VNGMPNAYLTYARGRFVQAVVVSILPGDPITSVLRDPQNGFTEDQIREIIAAQGLDQPLFIRFWASLSHFLIGDLGLSMRSSRPVTTLIGEVLPSTLILAFGGMLVALLLAVTIGYGSRFVPKRFGNGLLRAFPSLFLSVPSFVIGLVLIHAFGFQLGLFRVIEPNSLWATVFAAIALGIPISARIAEVLIANLDHEAAREYATVARARGLGPARLFVKHLLKPSALPVVTVIALTIGELLGGSLITETVFGRTGIGSLVQRSAATHDVPVLQAVVSLAAAVFVLVNLAADLVYPLLDPRMKLAGAARRRPTTADEASPDTSKAMAR